MRSVLKIVGIGTVGLITLGLATQHDVSLGVSYEVFTKKPLGQETFLTQFNNPWNYVYSDGPFQAFVSSGLTSTVPFSVEGEPMDGSKQSLSDTRLGIMAPLWQKRLVGSASCVLPAGREPLKLGEVTTEVALADQDFQFSQIRLRDGANWNFSIAYLQKIQKVMINVASGYFMKSEYDDVNPGNFYMLDVGVVFPIGVDWKFRQDLIYTHNFALYGGEVALSKQGNALTYLASATKKVSNKKKMKAQLVAALNGRNSIADTALDKNGNRNMIGVNGRYDFGRDEGVILTPVIGVDHYFANEIHPNSQGVDKFKPSQTRAELGLEVAKPLNGNLTLKTRTSGFVGTNRLLGTILSATIQWGAVR